MRSLQQISCLEAKFFVAKTYNFVVKCNSWPKKLDSSRYIAAKCIVRRKKYRSKMINIKRQEIWALDNEVFSSPIIRTFCHKLLFLSPKALVANSWKCLYVMKQDICCENYCVTKIHNCRKILTISGKNFVCFGVENDSFIVVVGLLVMKYFLWGNIYWLN